MQGITQYLRRDREYTCAQSVQAARLIYVKVDRRFCGSSYTETRPDLAHIMTERRRMRTVGRNSLIVPHHTVVGIRECVPKKSGAYVSLCSERYLAPYTTPSHLTSNG